MSDCFDQLPSELRAYHQWVVWKYDLRDGGNTSKVLYGVESNRKASVADPSSWATYDSAVACARAGVGYDGIGFVFTENDPFCGVDLDVKEGSAPSDLQQFTFTKLSSYTEFSPSGRGVHVIVKGNVPHGRNDRKLGIEVYDKGRYFTMTGNRVNNLNIEDRASMVLELWHEIGGVFDDHSDEPYDIKHPAIVSDDVLISRICKSGKNNAYFNWTAAFDWSEAYRSVLGAACLFSSDEAQVRRVIMASPLVTNAPAHGRETRPRRVERLWAREYSYAARQGDAERGDAAYRIWSQQWFPGGSRELYAQTMQQMQANAEVIIAANTQRILDAAKSARRSYSRQIDVDALPVPLAVAGLTEKSHLDPTPPGGVFAEMVVEVMAHTRNPSDIMAIWAVLGFVSGAVGRAYVTEEGAGVNNFFILSAGTNTGKTQHWSALEDMVRIAAPNLLAHIFGGDAASAQIIAKEGQKNPSMVFRLPDAGPWLNGLVDAKTQHQMFMRSALLNIYEAAGTGRQWLIPKSIRAREDGNETIDEFNMSIVLDTTPQYISDFDLSDFTDGLISRFIVLFGPEEISSLQRPKTGGDLPLRTRHTLEDLYKLTVAHSRPSTLAVNMIMSGVPTRIVISHDAGLADYMWELENEITEKIRAIQGRNFPPHYIAASRVVLNAKKVAACVAILETPAQPVITREVLDWALRLTLSSVTRVIMMFDSGEMGGEESKQEAAILDFIQRAVAKHPDRPYVTLSELGKYVDKLAPFKNAKIGPRRARNQALADLYERGVLIKTNVQNGARPKTVIAFTNAGETL